MNLEPSSQMYLYSHKEILNELIELYINKKLPNKIILYQNYPNPFNPVTTMKFSLLEDSYVKFDIYDLSGNLILNLIEGRLTAGISSIDWNGANHIGQKVSTGVYIYRLEIDGVAHNKKMIYLK